MKRISPRWIETLNANEVFVFGSNIQGLHGGGAAALAQRWGAIWGQGVGLQGQTYAIPTMQGSLEKIEPYVNEFLIFTQMRLDLVFLVTEVGCGLAGYTVQQMAPLFKSALDEKFQNVYLPNSFHDSLTSY
jgi:hypothetical protein